MKSTENFAQNGTHLYAICGANFIQRYTFFLKIYRTLSGKMLPTMIILILMKYTKQGGFSLGELSTMNESSLKIR